MATISAVIVPAKALVDGRHKIRISVSHNSETRYIVTNIIIDSIKEFKNGCVVKRPDAAFLNTKLRKLLQRYQNVVDDTDYVEGLTCPELVFLMKKSNEVKQHTLQSVYNEYISVASVRQSTCRVYCTAWSTIAKLTDVNIPIQKFGYANLMALDKAFRKKKYCSGTMAFYMTVLQSVFNYAKRCRYISREINPFEGYHKPDKTVRDSWLTVDEIRNIRDAELKKKNLKKYRDLFMLSYYLGGINMADLVRINFNECKDVIRYERIKTSAINKINRYVEFTIPIEAQIIIDRYRRNNGSLFSNNSIRDSCSRNLYYNLPKIADAAGIKKLFFYSARKSFSQHAFNLGVSASVIDYILGHKLDRGGTSLYSYISVTPEMATKAIRLVIDNLNGDSS